MQISEKQLICIITIYYDIHIALNKYIIRKLSFETDIVDEQYETFMSRDVYLVLNRKL